MFIACDWLGHYIDHQQSPESIAEILTNTGLEVEDQQTFYDRPPHLEDLFIGQVQQVEPHPDADNLSVTQVATGEGDDLQIICGAPNVASGQKVVVAPVGTTIQHINGEQLTIKKSKIRGVRSYGMLVAEDEIGLSYHHDGIMVLDDNAQVGQALVDYMKFPAQTVLEVALTPNRGDAASHLGVARDLSAYLDQPLEKPDVNWFQGSADEKPVSIKIHDEDYCPRYTGVVLEGIQVGPSPDWLQHHLRAVGLQPINNIVDVTNFVMMEMGHPLHAFNYHALAGETVHIRKAEKGSHLVTLDGVDRSLEGDELLIADDQKPLALAGIMGGENSAVTEDTSAIFLESAYFDPTAIRKAAGQHNLLTDASFRFERGTDPEATITALKRAALFIQEVAGGTIASDVLDAYPQPATPVQLTLSYDYLDKVLGDHIPRDRIQQILERLGFTINSANQSEINLTVPTFRSDVTRAVDVVEEIMRIYSLNALTDDQLPLVRFSHQYDHTNNRLQQKLARYLTAQGFMEVITPPFTSKDTEKVLGGGKAPESGVEVVNPLNQAQDHLRTSCLPSGLEAISYNLRRKQQNLRLFEMGKVYYNKAGQYREENWLSLFLTGFYHSASWYQSPGEVDLFYLKGLLHNILHLAGIETWDDQATSLDGLHNGLSIQQGSENLAHLGTVSPNLLKSYQIKQQVLYASVSVDALVKSFQSHSPKFRPVSKYPQIERDLAVVVPEDTPFEVIKDTIHKSNIPELVSLNLFDVYKGENIEDGYKSMAIRFVLQDEEKTMEDDRIDAIMRQLVEKLHSETNATVRH
jgi:phenylalanyl-tRNA synthetase beta chain